MFGFLSLVARKKINDEASENYQSDLGYTKDKLIEEAYSLYIKSCLQEGYKLN